jgi:aquaporin Z
MGRCSAAEFLGTFWLVLGGCGAAVIAGVFPYSADPATAANFFGLGFLGVSLAFGLTVVTMAYAIGHVSGCHLNPAVTVGLWAAGRFPGDAVLPYVVSQVLGAVVGGGFLSLIAHSREGFVLKGSNPLATNGYGAHSPGGYPLLTCLLVELVLTFVFLVIILGATDARGNPALAGLAIGLALTLIHLISIPVTATSVNPARSSGVAVWAGMESMRQLWLFWLAPLVGAALAGAFHRAVLAGDVATAPTVTEAAGRSHAA